MIALSSTAAGCAWIQRFPWLGGSPARQNQLADESASNFGPAGALADQQAAATLYLFFKDPDSLWSARPGSHT